MHAESPSALCCLTQALTTAHACRSQTSQQAEAGSAETVFTPKAAFVQMTQQSGRNCTVEQQDCTNTRFYIKPTGGLRSQMSKHVAGPHF